MPLKFGGVKATSADPGSSGSRLEFCAERISQLGDVMFQLGHVDKILQPQADGCEVGETLKR